MIIPHNLNPLSRGKYSQYLGLSRKIYIPEKMEHAWGLLMHSGGGRGSKPGGGGGTQMLFGRGCAAEASKLVPIFKGHFGGKGYPLLGVWRKRVPIIRDF